MRYIPSIPPRLRGLLAVFLIYFYFLEFSQFTFLHLMDNRVSNPGGIKAVLGAMALAGIGGSLAAVRLGGARRSAQVYLPAFLLCSLVASLAPLASGIWAFMVLALLMGLSMGVLTVTTAGILPVLLPGSRRGLWTGLATGLAYAVSNLPALFSASPEARSWTCAVAMLPGAVAFVGWNTRVESREEQSPPALAESGSQSGWGWIVTAFMVLIWLDSALFYIIQETPFLKGMSWGGNGQLLLNGAFHCAAAVFSGWILDHGLSLLPLVLAWLALSAGAVGLQYFSAAGATFLYITGVSFYSCALVYLPSRDSSRPCDRASLARAARVYILAGWIGSAMGIGMAENLSRIPATFLVGSGFLIFPVFMKLLQRR